VTVLFPRGVRLWHFIVYPAVAMAILIALSRLADDTIARDPRVAHSDAYQIARTAIIALSMSSLMAWLAFNYRRGYEEQLEARNVELEAIRDFLTSIVEGSAEAIITMDRDGVVTSWNRAAEKIYGWTSDDMIGQPLDRLRAPDRDTAAAMREIDRRVRNGEVVEHVETERVHRDGKRMTVHVTRTALYDPEERLLGIMSMEHDVTGLREMETKLREQECLAAVGQLAASVAHEIKNPLAGIRGACEIISDGFAPEEPKKELAEEVLRQVDRLNRTVQELLIFARPQRLKPAVVDLNEMLRRVLNLLEDDDATRHVEFVRAFDPGLPAILVDPQQVEQVFFNVVLNAIQFQEGPGRVEITTGSGDGHVRVSVRDVGPGIPDDVLEHVFEPFFTTRARGTGLGLAIVKKIVEGHGGSVDIDTEVGRGTTVTVHFPLET
jgi:two-component system sporulation sensor kinase A